MCIFAAMIFKGKFQQAYIYISSLHTKCDVGLWCIIFSLCIMTSCTSEKFLQKGETLLTDVKISSPQKGLKLGKYRNYIRQEPNAKWFGFLKVPLGIYTWSKADSSSANKGMSKIWRKIGEAPVIYDEQLTELSRQNLEYVIESEGFLHAKTEAFVETNGYKTKVNYVVHPGSRFYVSNLCYIFDDLNIQQKFLADSAQTLLRQGMPLSLNFLAEERTRIIQALHNRGYFYLNKDFVSYDIDTIAGSLGAKVTLHFSMPAGCDSDRVCLPQHYRRVRIIEGLTEEETLQPADSVYYRGLEYKYEGKQHFNKRLFVSHVSQRPDSLYSELGVQNTYGSLNALSGVNYTTIRMNPVDKCNDSLDCDIFVQPNKRHTIGVELEGTNTSGDLGAAVALTYSNRNVFHGSEQLSLKARCAYEAITGLEGYSNQNYIEWSAEANMRFPNLLLPFIGIDNKRKLKSSSDLHLMYDTQNRPEFHRRVFTGAWTYRWTQANKPNLNHSFDLFSLNYVYMPWISDTFKKDYLEGEDSHYSVLRYSYEDLFIMKMGYNFTYNSLRDKTGQPSELYQTNGYQIKMAFELAGNLLYGLSKATHSQPDDNGNYKIFGIAYSQYAKVDFDFAKSTVLNDRNSLAFHVAFGFGLPYGNSTILPYEKRYFSGGANSVRGWSVRGLGPGAYKGKDGKVDFINQTGNLKLDLSIELRTFLFWKMHGAFFIDAGNVWNTRSYSGMEGSLFKFNSFYKQIAVSYGLGIRFNFDYFILRFDGGMKAIDPSVPTGRLHYPISKPNFGRDFTFHFAVGLPF